MLLIMLMVSMTVTPCFDEYVSHGAIERMPQGGIVFDPLGSLCPVAPHEMRGCPFRAWLQVPTQRRNETDQQQYRTLWAMLEPTAEPPNEEKQVNRDSLRNSSPLSKVFQDDSTQVLVLNTTTRDRGDFVCVPWNTALKSLLSTSENMESISLFAKEVNGDQKTPCQVTDEGLWFYASYIPPFGSKRFDIIAISTAVVPSVTSSVLPNGNISLENERVVLVVDSTTGDVVSLRKKTDDVEFVAGSGDTHYGWGHVEFLRRDRELQSRFLATKGTNIFTKNHEKRRFFVPFVQNFVWFVVKTLPNLNFAVCLNGDGIVMKEVEFRRSVQLSDGKTAMLRRSYRLFADSDRIHIGVQLDWEPRTPFAGPRTECEAPFLNDYPTMVVHFPLNITKPDWFVDSPFAVTDDKENPIRTHRWYTLLANSQCGVDIMGLDYGDIGLDTNKLQQVTLSSFVPIDSGCVTSRYVLCPYIAPPEHSIAAHLGQEAHFPLIAVPVSPLKNTETAGIVLDNPCLVISDYRPAPDRSGDILLSVTNPTERKERLSLISKDVPLPCEWVIPAGETVQLQWSRNNPLSNF